MSELHQRRAWNEHTCRRCGRVIVAQFPICEDCARTIERLNLARETLAEAERDRERRFPPERARP